MSAEKISTDKKKIFKPAPISGFPEWLPEVRAVEQGWLDHIRRVFESYGYCNIETPAVEALDAIRAKGEDVDKEIYVLERLHREEAIYLYSETAPEDLEKYEIIQEVDRGDGTTGYVYMEKSMLKEARLALHFDQTVPMARYVAQHFNELDFPFKRYQMQKVWRGERPQMGRMREFYQCDIDVINVDQLPLHFDAEVAAVMYEILSGLDIGRVQLRINNRKIFLGLMNSILYPDAQAEVLRVIDKREKLEPEIFEKQLAEVLTKYIEDPLYLEYTTHDLNELFKYRDTLVKLPLSEQIQKLEQIYIGHASYEEYQKLKETNDLPTLKTPKTDFYEGLKDLIFVLKNLIHLPKDAVIADFFMVRGLDYYTGTVYETQLLDVPEFTGSVCSGGRYDDLAGSYINKHLPGVGISIGFSRLFDVMRQAGKLPVGRKTPTDILVVLWGEESRAEAAATAVTLRKNGWNVELYHAPQKIGKQFGYAEKKGIPYVWLPPSENENFHQIKDMTAKEQKPADPKTWVKT